MSSCLCNLWLPQPWIRRVNEIFFKPVTGVTTDAAIVRLAEYAALKPNHLSMISKELERRCLKELKRSVIRVNIISIAARAYVALLETISTLGGGSYNASAVGKVGALGIFEQHITSLLVVLLTKQNVEIVDIGASLARSFLTALATSAAGHEILSFSTIDQTRLDLLLLPLVRVAGALPGSPGASINASIASLCALKHLLIASNSQTLDTHIRIITSLSLSILFRNNTDASSSSSLSLSSLSPSSEVLASADELLHVVASYVNASTSSSVFDPTFAFLDEKFWKPTSFAIKICSILDAHASRDTWGIRQGNTINPERPSSSSSSSSAAGVGLGGVSSSTTGEGIGGVNGQIFSFTSPFRLRRSLQSSSFSTPGYLLLLRHVSVIDSAFFGIPAAAFFDASQRGEKTLSKSPSISKKPLNSLWWLRSNGVGNGTFNENVVEDIIPRLDDLEQAEIDFETLRLNVLLVSDALFGDSRSDMSIGPFVKETLDHLFPVLVENSEDDLQVTNQVITESLKAKAKEKNRQSRQQQVVSFSLLNRILSRMHSSTDLLRFTSHALEMFGDHVAEFIAFHGPLQKSLLSVLDIQGGITEGSESGHMRGISTISSVLASSSTLPASRINSMSLRRMHSVASSTSSAIVQAVPHAGKRRHSVKTSGLSVNLNDTGTGPFSPITSVGDIELTIRTEFSNLRNSHDSGEKINDNNLQEADTDASDSLLNHITMARLRLLLLVYRGLRRLRTSMSGGTSINPSNVASSPASVRASAHSTHLAEPSSKSKNFFFRSESDISSTQQSNVLEAPVEVLRGLELALSDPDARVKRLAACALHEFLCCDGPIRPCTTEIDGDDEFIQWTENEVLKSAELAYFDNQEAVSGNITSLSNSLHMTTLVDTARHSENFTNASKLTLRNESASRLFLALSYAASDACSSSNSNSSNLDSMSCASELALLVRLVRDLVRIGGVSSIFRFALPLAFSTQTLTKDTLIDTNKVLLEKLFTCGVLSVVSEAVGAMIYTQFNFPSLAAVKDGWITRLPNSTLPISSSSSLSSSLPTFNSKDDINNAALAILTAEGTWKAITSIGIPLPVSPQGDIETTEVHRLRLTKSALAELHSIQKHLSDEYSILTANAVIPLPPAQNDASWSSYDFGGGHLRYPQYTKNHISALFYSLVSLDSAWRRVKTAKPSSDEDTSDKITNTDASKDAASEFFRFLLGPVPSLIGGKTPSLPPRVPSSFALSSAHVSTNVQTTQSVQTHEVRLLALLLGLLTVDWKLGSPWMHERCEGLIDVWPLAASSTAAAVGSDEERRPESNSGRFTARVTLSAKRSSYNDTLRTVDGIASASAAPASPYLFSLFTNNVYAAASDFLMAARGSPITSSPLSKSMGPGQSSSQGIANGNGSHLVGQISSKTIVTRSNTNDSTGTGESQLLQWRPSSILQSQSQLQGRKQGSYSHTVKEEGHGERGESTDPLSSVSPDLAVCLDLLKELELESRKQDDRRKEQKLGLST